MTFKRKIGILLHVFLIIASATLLAQMNPSVSKNPFWERVQIGGAVGASFGSGFTDVTLAPSAIYNFNPYFAAGVGIQGSYGKATNRYEQYVYGGSLIALGNPIPEIQLSAEVEQLKVDRRFSNAFFNDGSTILQPSSRVGFWNTALFLGAGYRTGPATIGVRYNVLYDKNDAIYGQAFFPFARVYF